MIFQGFWVGLILFVIGVLFSVAWHELGHMWLAKWTGMKVRRYFIGFGPTLWSCRKNDTEYGIKMLPFGGFCDIAGTSNLDNMTPAETPYAMYKQKIWKRILVLLAGPAQNIILGMLLIYIIALVWGVPNLATESKPTVTSLGCVAKAQNLTGELSICKGKGPAQKGGLKVGDVIVAINGKSTISAINTIDLIRHAKTKMIITVERSSKIINLLIYPELAKRKVINPISQKPELHTVLAIGAGIKELSPEITKSNPVTAVSKTLVFTGQTFKMTAQSLLNMPNKIIPLWKAVTGAERDLDTPISVYGASVIGGEVVKAGYWNVFFMLLASMNFFLAIFNLIPLLPFDGGHIAVALYEKIRNTYRKILGKKMLDPVDYRKLMPITYAVFTVLIVFLILTLSADIINPIKIF